MASLSRELRRELERTVKQARKVAEDGATKAIDRLGVGHAQPPKGITADEQALRRRLRAHGRQLGDIPLAKGAQATTRLVSECAYEHWHRLLFARFLAENELLIEPEHQLSITLEDCQELAREQGLDWLELASSYATRMLPQIFRQGDPVLEVQLPPENRSQLEDLLNALPRETFLADDSLGWVYQFWQADRNEEIKESESKIGADELPAMTQFFTEDYMVLFLLHNTLGAWWAGKVLAARPELATTAQSEAELRSACGVGDVEWTYLRFVRDDDGTWRPAAGTFDGWPKTAREITVLDPCMGSGHFLVFALPILVALRMEEEGLSQQGAVDAVLRDNLHGLEIDPRCTQIAAFNLALAAWKLAGYHELPHLQLACSGLTPAAPEEVWLQLADQREMDHRTEVLAGEFIRDSLRYLHKTFSQAPTLGSLIDPTEQGGGMFSVDFDTLRPYLNAALKAEADEEVQEQAVIAAGMVKAAELLAREYVLVITNVPYLGRGKQDETLQAWANEYAPEAKADLATMFISRTFQWLAKGGSLAVVSPQNWLFLTSFKKLRERLLRDESWNIVARLGSNAFQDMNWWAATTTLLAWTKGTPAESHVILGIDVSTDKQQQAKAAMLRGDVVAELRQLLQAGQRTNPDSAIDFDSKPGATRLGDYAIAVQGIGTGDLPRWLRLFWELKSVSTEWQWFQMTPDDGGFSGLHGVVYWQQGKGELARIGTARKGLQVLGKPGLMVSVTGQLQWCHFMGQRFDCTVGAIVPISIEHLPAVIAFAEDENFIPSVRAVDQALSVTEANFLKVPFDIAHWQQVAEEKYPNGLPEPDSDDLTQWLFHGRPEQSSSPLQGSVARLLGYYWPAELDSEMRLSQRARELVGRCGELVPHADADGIVCLTPIKGEASAADRLTRLLADAYGSEWSAGKLDSLLRDVGYAHPAEILRVRGFLLGHFRLGE